MSRTFGNTTPVSLRGNLGLAVAMGMGRFFYTPALPLMVAALNWDAGPGSWIATLNYVGYFIGTLVIAQGWVEPNQFVYRLSLIVSTLGLAAVALTPNLLWQGSIRTIAGIASGLIFVCVTQRIPANSRKPRDGGISYGGVGFGILVSGAIVLTTGSFADWRQLWLICAAVSAVFSIIAWTWPIPAHVPASPAIRKSKPSPDADGADTTPFDANRRRAMAILSVGYFFQGGGYIIIGTYLVVLAGPVFGDTAAASTWLVAGLATAPSPLIWSAVAVRIGTFRSLTLCYSLQVFGALLAVFGSSPIVLFIAAALFGFTFIGVVMMTIGIGTQMGVANASAKLTSWYSIGQIAGPALVAAALSENITAAFIASAIALAIAMVLTLIGTLTGNVERCPSPRWRAGNRACQTTEAFAISTIEASPAKRGGPEGAAP